MDIDLSFDASVRNAPAGFTTALQAAVTYLDGLITNPITVNINVGYGEYNGQPLSGGDSEGGPQGIALSYAQLVSELTANATSAADRTAVANLPATDPTGGGMFLVSDALQKAWGLLPANGTENDGTVGFNSSTTIPYDFATNGTVAPGELDFVGIAEHELTHVLGRIAGLQFSPGWYAPLDLFRYAPSGGLELVGGEPAYFSIDGGRTNLDNFATFSDYGDWASSAGPDSFDAISEAGVINPMTATDITEMDVLGFDVACFAAGTRIATARGPVAVEALRVGDRLVTARGTAEPVVWLGSRRVACRRHPRPDDVWPIRVQMHAFGAGAPVRDLLLSPDHSVLVRGALIPVRYLVNGATIAQEAHDTVEYWHVELPRHDVLLAEALPAESYLDTGNRSAFQGGGPALQAHAEFSRSIWRRRGCAPLVAHGAALARARRRLLRRAAALRFRLTGDPALRLRADGRDLPAECDGARWRAALPAGTRRVTLFSRTWVPAHLPGAGVDTRRLGVMLSRLWLDGREASLDSPGLASGWHAPEPGCRWTAGNGELAVENVREIAFEFAGGRYWTRPAELTRAA
jgi:hypothetical protein